MPYTVLFTSNDCANWTERMLSRSRSLRSKGCPYLEFSTTLIVNRVLSVCQTSIITKPIRKRLPPFGLRPRPCTIFSFHFCQHNFLVLSGHACTNQLFVKLFLSITPCSGLVFTSSVNIKHFLKVNWRDLIKLDYQKPALDIFP